MHRGGNLYGSDFVFGAIGCPIGIFRGHDVRARFGIVESCVNDAWLHAGGDFGAERNVALTAGERNAITLIDATCLCIMRMYFKQIFFIPNHICGAACLCANVVLSQCSAGGEQQWETTIGAFLCRHIVGLDKHAFTAYEAIDVHNRCAHRRLLITRPLHAAEAIQKIERNTLEGWR